MPTSRGSVCEDEDGISQPRIVANRYEVVRRLGNLGLDGVAYLVRDLQADSCPLRTLKEIHVGQLSPSQLRQLLDEAEMLSQLNHLLLSTPLESFLDGEFYCSISHYWEEGDLGQVLIACKQAGRFLPESQIAAWFVQLCLAVRYLHSRGIIHRNLKSSNVFLDSGRIRIGDLCPSLLMLGHHKATTSIFYGTPHYTSPEVLRHDGVTSQCDLWSMGCILFEMCHLRYAFDSQSMMGVVYNVVRGRSNPLPSGPRQYGPELLSAIDALLRPVAEDRERSASLLGSKYFGLHLNSLRNQLLASDPDICRVLARREAAARAAEARERAAEAARLEEERLLAEVRGGLGGGRRRGDGGGEDADFDGDDSDGPGGPLINQPGVQLPYSGRGGVSLTLACEADWERRMRDLLEAGSGGNRHPTGPEPLRSNSRLVGNADVPDGQDAISRCLYGGGGAGGIRGLSAASSRSNNRQWRRGQSSLHYDIGSVPLLTAATPRDGPRRVEPGTLGLGSAVANGDATVGHADNQADDEINSNSDVDVDGDDGDEDDEETAAALLPHPGADLVEQIDNLAPLPCVADSVCFTPASRAVRIEMLRRQALARLPKETFDRLAEFLREARSTAGWKEAELQDRLASMHPRLADCFLVDQLVFLEACQREE
ncbi:hypothetical protein BOX15_Mlig013032g1 [Macrostomum lignano]|uniref:non-specific serine/threonine protein kinase n=1 Tax=Macrostomum lignano TaxID=282301 RepID=A0A267GZR5_9PLAT|nr:hypothetical protein BOX15_Mlig013032g1 [Macrostomum lignano]